MKTTFGFSRYHQGIVSYGTIYDMQLDPLSKRIVTSGQDKKINIWTISTGKPERSYKLNTDFGEPIKLQLDPSGMYIATSSTDKVWIIILSCEIFLILLRNNNVRDYASTIFFLEYW